MKMKCPWKDTSKKKQEKEAMQLKRKTRWKNKNEKYTMCLLWKQSNQLRMCLTIYNKTINMISINCHIIITWQLITT